MGFIEILKYVLLVIGSYLIGNISFARIISKLNHKDITKSGSGNPGSMNMLRSYGFKFGILTLILDTLKGAIPALVGSLIFSGNPIGIYVAGVSVILGHIYPVFYKFKGGKGIACTLGVFLVADPLWFLVFFALAFLYLLIFDYGSIASLFVVSALIIIEGAKASKMPYETSLPVCILLFTIFVLTWFAHRTNIKRLLIGKENKANLQQSLKKHFKKEKTAIKNEYKEEKTLKENEYKQQASVLTDKQELKAAKKHYKMEKKEIKKQYKKRKRKVYDYAHIVELVSVKDENQNQDNE